MRRIKNLGIGLLELLLSIAVITGVLLTITGYYSTVQNNYRTTKALSMIATAKDASYRWLEGKNQKAFTGLTTLSLANLALIPTSWGPDNNQVNPWGGSIRICQNPNSPVPNNALIILTNVPQSACKGLAAKTKATFGGTVAVDCTTGATAQLCDNAASNTFTIDISPG